MPENSPQKNFSVTDYLANERTFLAWIRTCIGIMAFGFLIERFALFLTQLSVILLANDHPNTIRLIDPHHASIFGIVLIGVGAIFTLLSFWKYNQSRKQIKEGKFSSHPYLEGFLTVIIFIVGVVLILSLI